MTRLDPADAERFIRANTAVQAPPHVPEVRLHLASEAHGLWLKTEEELEAIGLPPPFWAFAWAGGQGLARFVLDHASVATVPGSAYGASPYVRVSFATSDAVLKDAAAAIGAAVATLR